MEKISRGDSKQRKLEEALKRIRFFKKVDFFLSLVYWARVN
jgi:hypothetical protein